MTSSCTMHTYAVVDRVATAGSHAYWDQSVLGMDRPLVTEGPAGSVAQWVVLNGAPVGAQLLRHCLQTPVSVQACTVCQASQVTLCTKECLLTDDFGEHHFVFRTGQACLNRPWSPTGEGTKSITAHTKTVLKFSTKWCKIGPGLLTCWALLDCQAWALLWRWLHCTHHVSCYVLLNLGPGDLHKSTGLLVGEVLSIRKPGY